jgi:RNA methyltransferase, TrmH family
VTNNPELISSRNNIKIKQVRSLKQRKQRQLSGLFVVEGIFPIGEAVEAVYADSSLVEIEAIYYAPELLSSDFARGIIRKVSNRGVACHATTADVFMSISEKENPQGILALVRTRHWQLEELDPRNFAWGVALISPQDPGNLGTILRTVNAVGASGLLLLDGGADAHHPHAVRASMGALFWHPVVRATFSEFASWVDDHGYSIYGTSAHAEKDYLQILIYKRPLILLMGSEREGLSPTQRDLCHELVRIPMVGRATSLNLAVATGVMLYEMLEKIG